MAKITLTRYGGDMSQLPESLRHSWPLTLHAVGVGMEGEIFVFHAGKAEDVIEGDRFECVASLSQMLELPKNKPATGLPFYRLNQLDMICRTAVEAEETYQKIKKDVEALVDNLNAAALLLPVETVEIGSESTASISIVQTADAWLITAVSTDDYELTAPTYDSDGVIVSSPVLWSDGSLGVFTTTVKNTEFAAIDAFTITHTNSGKTVTQPPVTRDANGAITIQLPLVVS